MKTQTKETNTLHVMRDEDNGRYLVMRGDVLIADCGKGNFGKTESERIAIAVNAHDELPEALKFSLKVAEAWYEDEVKKQGNYSGAGVGAANQEVKRLKEIIAKASSH